MPKIPNLRIINPRHNWVRTEFEKLITEWEAWEEEVAQIQDHPYQREKESEVFKDGKKNMRKHMMLQEKTRVFLDNNIEGHNFIHGFNGNHIDRTDLRLKIRTEHRLDQLYILKSALTYALVADSFWKESAKDLLGRIADKGTDAAVEIAASYLENPIKHN